MNEIKKMYKNANVEKHLAYFECHRGRSSMRCCPINSDERDKGCFSCFFRDKMKEVYQYPPFTAEKQLELIKFLSWHFEYGIKITKYLNGFSINNYTGTRCSELSKTFDESLASIVNKIWQDLTPEEKQQIKELLE